MCCANGDGQAHAVAGVSLEDTGVHVEREVALGERSADDIINRSGRSRLPMSRVVACGEVSANPVRGQGICMAGGIVHKTHTFSASGVHGALTIGRGSGINRPVLAAKYTRRVSGALLVGGGGFPVFFTGRESNDPEIARPSLDPADHVGKIAPRPLVMVNVTLDLLVAPMFAKALHNAAGKNSSVIWYETNHYFNGQDRVKIVQEDVIDFLLEHMPENRRKRSKPKRRIAR